MRLGSSLRRSRPAPAPKPAPRPEERGGGPGDGGGDGGSGGGPAPGGSGDRRRRGRGLVAFLVVALGIVVASGVGYAFATQVVFPLPEVEATNFVEVPALTGLEIAAAEEQLAAAGLVLAGVDSIHHPRAEVGVVVGQAPLAGQLATPEGEVRLTVSEGPERRTVPDVTRMRADRAITVLETAGFHVSVDSIATEFPAGRVYATVPEGGTERSLPTRVYLTVSLGPPPFPMPDLVGMEEDEARMVLESLGLEVGEVDRRTDFGFFFASPEVLEHTPAANEMVTRGSAVRLVIRRAF